jgi:hypothetical protein
MTSETVRPLIARLRQSAPVRHTPGLAAAIPGARLARCTLYQPESAASTVQVTPELSNGQFILFAYECLLERGPMEHEVAGWDG